LQLRKYRAVNLIHIERILPILRNTQQK